MVVCDARVHAASCPRDLRAAIGIMAIVFSIGYLLAVPLQFLLFRRFRAPVHAQAHSSHAAAAHAKYRLFKTLSNVDLIFVGIVLTALLKGLQLLLLALHAWGVIPYSFVETYIVLNELLYTTSYEPGNLSLVGLALHLAKTLHFNVTVARTRLLSQLLVGEVGFHALSCGALICAYGLGAGDGCYLAWRMLWLVHNAACVALFVYAGRLTTLLTDRAKAHDTPALLSASVTSPAAVGAAGVEASVLPMPSRGVMPEGVVAPPPSAGQNMPERSPVVGPARERERGSKQSEPPLLVLSPPANGVGSGSPPAASPRPAVPGSKPSQSQSHSQAQALTAAATARLIWRVDMLRLACVAGYSGFCVWLILGAIAQSLGSTGAAPLVTRPVYVLTYQAYDYGVLLVWCCILDFALVVSAASPTASQHHQQQGGLTHVSQITQPHQRPPLRGVSMDSQIISQPRRASHQPQPSQQQPAAQPEHSARPAALRSAF